MSHFSADHWIDFTRNLLPATPAVIMQGHLEQGCLECERAFETWSLVVDWSSKERFYRAPDEAVRIAKAAFLPHQATSGWLRQIAQFASLTFDSFRQPATAAVRSATGVSRQLVHDAQPYTIDLKLESDAVRKQIHLVGQILDAQNPDRSFEAVDVVLLRGSQLVTRTPASPSGEFQLRFKTDGELQLFINIRGERAIGVNLPPLEN